jgi:DNA-binding SARP family transcriptional activator/Tfp pilus assembly protein PilF
MPGSDLQVFVLGQPQLILNGKKLTPPTKKALGLIVYLALQGPTPRSQVATLFWGEFADSDARRNLRQELYRLSKTPLGLHLVQGDVVYLIAFETDANTFRRALESRRYGEALTYWRGSFLDGFDLPDAEAFEVWLTTTREQLKLERHRALEGQASELESAGEVRAALKLRLALINSNEFQESHYREAMRLHALLGEREAALTCFERCKAVLRDELGLEPLPETVQLAERVRNALKLPEATSVTPGSQVRLVPPLIGREAIWQELKRLDQTPVLLVGQAGIGKTRLVTDFAQLRGSHVVVHGRESTVGIPFYPIAEAMRGALEQPETRRRLLDLPKNVKREMARLVAIEEGLEPSPNIPENRARFLRALADGLIGTVVPDGVLVFEDVHWLDALSAELMIVLIREAHRTQPGLELIITARWDELVANAELSTSFDALVRSKELIRLELEPLLETDVLRLVRAMSNSAGGTLFAQRLHRTTAGNPLFILETLRALFASGDLRLEGRTWVTKFDENTQDYTELPVPASVREAVLSRVERLGNNVRRLLEAASLTGGTFTLRELEGTGAMSQWQELEALEEAMRAQLVTAHGKRYAFSHDLVRRALEEALGMARQTLLHQKLAVRLARLNGSPEQIAHHLELGGQVREAIPWRLRAAEAAMRVYANHAALEQYAKALRDDPSEREAFAIHLQRTHPYQALGDVPGWSETVQHATAIADALGEENLITEAMIAQAQLEVARRDHARVLEIAQNLLSRSTGSHLHRAQALHLAGTALVQLGRQDEARAALQAALDQLGDQVIKLRGDTHIALWTLKAQAGDLDGASTHVQSALDDFTALRLRTGRASALMHSGTTAFMKGDPQTALTRYQQALQEAREVQHVGLERTTLVNLGSLMNAQGQFPQARQYLQTALEMARDPSDPFLEGAILAQLAQAFWADGDLGQALEYQQAAVESADRLQMMLYRVVRRCNQVLHWIEVGQPQRAEKVLKVISNLITPEGPPLARIGFEVQTAILELEHTQYAQALQRLHDIQTQHTLDANMQVWIQSLLAQAQFLSGQPDAALATLHDFQGPLEYEAAALGVQLQAQHALGRSEAQSVERALTLVQSTHVPAVDRLALGMALHDISSVRHQRKVRRLVGALIQQMADSLENHPDLRTHFLEKHHRLLNEPF